MNIVSIDTRERFLKAFTVITAVATILSLSGVAYLANGAAPADYGLKEGDLISAAGSDDPDVYIVNEQGYKRLFLSPQIFNLYGHLGGFAAVKNVSPATRDAFPTSGLFRVDGDEKVYGLQTTGEDIANLRWVNTSGAQAVADDPNFFKKVFVINAAEKALYGTGADFTSVTQVPVYARGGSVPTPTGPLSVSLAPGNPSATTITKNATGVEFLKVRFSGNGTVNTLTVKRLGAGETNDFSNVYVYDGAKRLVSGKTFSSSSGETTFLLNVAVSGSKDLSIVADMDATNNTAGNVNYISLVGVTAAGGASVSGAPLSGNNMTTSGASSGSVTIAKSGSLSNPTVGQKGAQLSEFKITANTEAASLRRLTMINGGTVKPTDITNLKLKTGTSEWSGTSTSDSYLVFDLGSGFTIAKGGNAVFKVYGDLSGKKDETINLYFENDADTHAVGDQYGQGMAVSDDALDAAADNTAGAGLLTLQGGVLTISFNGPTATNVATNATDVTMLRYSMTAASNIEVRKTEFVLCVDTTADGTFDAAAAEGEWDELNDFKVWNEDTNTVVMGPKDGTAFDDTNDTDSCPDSATGAGETFTDVFDLAAGKTYNFKVTVDFDTSLGGSLTAADSIVRVVLDRYDEDTADVTVMKYAGTNTAVADADIVPNADVSGPNITLKGSALTLGLASTPQDRTYIKGTSGSEWVGITFAASQGSGLKVTDIKLTGYVEDESGDTHNEGVDTTDSGVSVANAVSKVYLYEAESGALLSSTPSSNQLSVINTGTIAFTGLNWNIAAGATKTLLVKADLSTNEASGSNGDRYSFDINATTDVTAVDDSNNTVNPGNADPNGATVPTVDITVKNSGNLTVAAAPDTPVTAAAYWKQTGVDFSKFRFTATDEGQYLETVNFYTPSGDTVADNTNNVKAVYLTYKNKAGSTLTAAGSMNTGGSVSFSFTGDNRPYVSADSSMDVTVKTDMKSKAEGATNNVAFSIDFSGGAADEFRAVGESGTVMTGSDSDIVNRTGNDMYVYRVFPKFSKVTDTSLEANNSVLNPTEMEVLRFTVEAVGAVDSKLLFDNVAAGSGSIKFEIVASGVGTNSPAFKVYDAADGSSVDVDGTITNATVPSPKASMTFNFTSKDIEITGGASKTFYVRVDLTNFSHDGDYLQVVLRDDEAGLINWVADSTGSTGDADTASTTSVLRQLELIGTTKVRNI